jgi:hypothetical protein
MNKLNNELNRLDTFLLKLDKVILEYLNKDGFDTQDLSTLMGVREDILNRVSQIHKNQNSTKMWKEYSRKRKY